MPVTLLGIRHHGPGSCRHVVEYLHELKPDLILLEAPSDVAPMLDYVPSLSQALASPLPSPKRNEDKTTQAAPDKDETTAPALPELLCPPVALMAYHSDQPKNAVFYPFAEFSPEWQTMLYGKEHGIEVRPFDLPLSYLLAQRAAQLAEEEAAAEQPTASTPAEAAAEPDASKAQAEPKDTPERLVADPFDYLAELEGLADGEQWWENRIEQRIPGSLQKTPGLLQIRTPSK